MSVLLRQQRAAALRVCRQVGGQRSFSQTTQRQDLFDFLRRRSIKPRDEEPKPTATESSTPAQPQKKTSDVMSEVESSSSSEPVKQSLRIVGKPPSIQETWESEKNGFDLSSPWPIKLVAPELTSEAVMNALETNYAKIVEPKLTEKPADWKSAKLDDLQLRFDFSKAVIAELQVSIPDRVLSQLSTIGDIHDYYLDQVVGRIFNEKLPDAVYFNNEDFEGTNVTFVDADKEKKESKLRWKRLVQEAKEQQRQQQRELLDKALR